MEKYALVGKDVENSLSPIIHREFFKANHSDSCFELISTDSLITQLENLRTFDGFAITTPYQNEIIPYLDDASIDVRISNSCNCVVNRNGKWYGYNTQIWGFIDSLHHEGIDPTNCQVLILGCGSIASSLSCAFKKFQANVYVYNRNFAHAKKMSHEFNITALTNLKGIREQFDLIINCTPLGDFYHLNEAVVRPSDLVGVQCVIDANYVQDNLFLKSARSKKIKAVNGLSMLFYHLVHTQGCWGEKKLSDEQLNQIYHKVEGIVYENIGSQRT